ncbi:lipopolysaccharide biosynthesis protein [Derxia gummosa]|uniref:Lipopolysaccharide biosynthesis protein n=1 Tax=Derxia gummosa DSM 723 TaxID=1121388 RepID=A0A8B6X4Q5_9BURK|nr:oligosaccharide flippase family protein [Derxia gummosa]
MTQASAGAYSTQRVRRSLLHFAIGKSATAVLGAALLLVLVRALDRNDYGIYVALLAAFEIVNMVSNTGVLPALMRYTPELRSRGQGRALQTTIGGLSIWRLASLVIAAAALVLFPGPIAELMGVPGQATVVALYAAVIVAEGFARYTDLIFESLLMQGATQVSVLLRTGIRLGGLALLWHAAADKVALVDWVKVEIAASGAGSLAAAVMIWRHLGQLAAAEPGTEGKPDRARVLRYALPSWLAQSVYQMQGPEVVKLLLVRLAGAVEAGAFGFATAIGGIVQRYLPMVLLIGMLRPIFVAQRTRHDDPARLVALANLILKLNVFVIAPATTFFAVGGNTVASTLSGGAFPEAGPYLVAFGFLLAGQTLNLVLGLLALAVEDSRSVLVGTIWGLGGIVAGLVGYRVAGPLALCAGLVLSELLRGFGCSRVLRGHGIVFSFDWPGHAKLWAFAGISALCALPVVTALPGKPGVLAGLALAAVVYLVGTRIVRPFSQFERDTINRALPKPLFTW